MQSHKEVFCMGDLEAANIHAATVYQLVVESVVVNTKCVAKEKQCVKGKGQL